MRTSTRYLTALMILLFSFPAYSEEFHCPEEPKGGVQITVACHGPFWSGVEHQRLYIFPIPGTLEEEYPQLRDYMEHVIQCASRNNHFDTEIIQIEENPRLYNPDTWVVEGEKYTALTGLIMSANTDAKGHQYTTIHMFHNRTDYKSADRETYDCVRAFLTPNDFASWQAELDYALKSCQRQY